MNPRQRRGLVLIVLTSIAAVAVFFGIMTYVDDVGSRVGPSVQVLRLTRDVGVYEAITEDMLASVEMPERWVSGATLLADEQDDILGKVASSSFVAGTTVQTGMMVTPPAVEPGYREIAVMVDAETGVAGKVSPGDRVDIIATVGGTDTAPPSSRVWVSNAQVIDVGVARDVDDESDARASFESSSGVPVTFALTTNDALKVAYVESFSVKLRLALRGAGDTSEISEDQWVYTTTEAQG
ncbi:Flp pilus assembly protein CpaB [Sanguibacter antarcticus]|uniref:Pilus assembly protein CpaB n=1 Tax=Sanguibacter antarcticus TaxID=372484 RepID=A0A2A9E7Z8_9MICO|nr:Flp pilus assembly protein CpaB [Sanguibacter antarcticus]PFG34691.1 pilus assembly protein CpaB [Sanguibacter antarcticus]